MNLNFKNKRKKIARYSKKGIKYGNFNGKMIFWLFITSMVIISAFSVSLLDHSSVNSTFSNYTFYLTSDSSDSSVFSKPTNSFIESSKNSTKPISPKDNSLYESDNSIRVNDSLLYYTIGSLGSNYENITFLDTEIDTISNYWNYLFNDSISSFTNPNQNSSEIININVTDEYWKTWSFITGPFFIAPNHSLKAKNSEITAYLSNSTLFEPGAPVEYKITENSLNATGPSYGLIINLYMEFDLETGILVEFYYNDTMTAESWVLVDSTLDIPFLSTPSIFNVEHNQELNYTYCLGIDGDYSSYKIKYYGYYFANNQTNHFILADEKRIQNYEIIYQQWSVIGSWAENSTFSVDINFFLPYYLNLTTLYVNNHIYELKTGSNYNSFIISDYTLNITYNYSGFDFYRYYEFTNIADCFIRSFVVTTENAYDYTILTDFSLYRSDSHLSEVGIYPHDRLYYLERTFNPKENRVDIQFRELAIQNVICVNRTFLFIGNVYEGLNLNNLSLVAEHKMLGSVAYDPLNENKPIFLNPLNLEHLGNLKDVFDIYQLPYPFLHPNNRNFKEFEIDLINSSFFMNISSYLFMEIEENTIFSQFQTTDGKYHDFFEKSQFGLMNYWYFTTFTNSEPEATNNKIDKNLESIFEVTLYAYNDLNNSYDSINTTEWGISIGDSLVWYYSNSTLQNGTFELTQIYDIHLMPSGYYLLFGARYIWNFEGNEWIPALPLLNLGQNLSIPADILGIYGNGLYPCQYSPEVRPTYMFRDWSDAYFSLVSVYQKWEGPFNISNDFYYDNNKISITFRDLETSNKCRTLDLIYNEKGILQDYLDIFYDSNDSIIKWERKVLINGPGKVGEFFGNTTGGVPFNLTDIPQFPSGNNSNTDDSGEIATTENTFFGNIPPAIYAGVGFLAVLGAGTTIIIKKK